MQNSALRPVGFTFAILGLVLVISRGAAGIPFLVIGVTFLFISRGQDKKGTKRRGE